MSVLDTAPREVVVLGILLACSFQTAPPDAPPPDPDLQALIRASMSSANQTEMEERLEELAAAGEGRLVPQLLHYSVGAESMKDAMAFGIIVDALHIGPDALVEPLIPFLGSEDPELRAEAENILVGCEGGSLERAPDFEIYRPILEADHRAGKVPNAPLVRHLFKSHPGTALLLFRSMSTLSQEESRRVLWAEHVVADALWRYRHGFLKPDESDAAAAEQLGLLSRNAAWWARLYVAEVMRQHAALADPEVIAALKQDANELVRRASNGGP